MADSEFRAIEQVYSALNGLEADAQERVIRYVVARLGVPIQSQEYSGVGSPNGGAEVGLDGQVAFGEFGELFDAASPKSDAEKALVAAFWITEIEGAETFDSQTVNTHLKHLGHGIGNVTRAIDNLAGLKPSHAIQTRKSGSSKQARKTFKVTKAGREWVSGRLNEA